MQQPTKGVLLFGAVLLMVMFGVWVGDRLGSTTPEPSLPPVSNEPPTVEPAPSLENPLIHVTSPLPSATISSPLTITGEARGYWYFEASFPVELTDVDGNTLAQGIAQAQSDWMTEDFVPFVATLTFTPPIGDTHGFLLLKKDNPSGEPANDAMMQIPILFAP